MNRQPLDACVTQSFRVTGGNPSPTDIVTDLLAVLPRWREADPRDEGTWPEEGTKVLIASRQWSTGIVTSYDVTKSEHWPWATPYDWQVHWMPWSEIGDPP